MKQGSTLFLRVVICLLGLLGLGVGAILIGMMIGGDPGIFLPVMLGILGTDIPFLYALYQGLLLLRYIDQNTAFSDASVHALKTIKRCAFAISVLYAIMMPYIVYLAEIDDAPGAVVVGLLFMTAPLVVAVFAAVLQKLVESAIDIKSENDLTV